MGAPLITASWRLPDVVPVSKEFSSSDGRDCRSISIKHVLPRVLEKVVARKLSHFLEHQKRSQPQDSWVRKISVVSVNFETYVFIFDFVNSTS